MRSEISPHATCHEIAALTVWRDVLSRQDCRTAVETMTRSATISGPVLRASSDTVDPTMRRCSEHLTEADGMEPVVNAMRAVASRAIEGARRKRVALDGPKFCSYTEREFFRAHRDRSEDPRDPAVVRSRILSIVCLLNDTTLHDGLLASDGGALVVYLPGPDGSVTPQSVRLEAGSIVTFRSDLLHEVRPVRAGVRYSAVGWLYDRDDVDDHREKR